VIFAVFGVIGEGNQSLDAVCSGSTPQIDCPSYAMLIQLVEKIFTKRAAALKILRSTRLLVLLSVS
jgi:hypothetical protein